MLSQIMWHYKDSSFSFVVSSTVLFFYALALSHFIESCFLLNCFYNGNTLILLNTININIQIKQIYHLKSNNNAFLRVSYALQSGRVCRHGHSHQERIRRHSLRRR